ncbi:MAG: energy transducer TonB [Bacteroidota bacterium]|nr:energy transducer TonB [Bacteroidota bacterium]
MEANQILKSDILDIIFDGKNKAYGAYDLRKTYNKRISKALIFTISLILLLLIGSAIADKIGSKDKSKEMVVKETVLQQIKPDEPPPPPPPPPPKLPPPPPIATIQFTPPKVVKDEEVIKPPPEVKQIEEAKVDVKTVEGTKDLGIVAPPSDLQGTQVVAAPVEKKEDPDKIFTKVEIEAQFPGGPQAWAKYVQRAIMRDQDELTDPNNFGTCVVKFIVDRDGVVSDVQATTMKGTKLAEIAVNAIRKGPKWTPAQQNGRFVNAYRLQPVTLTNPDQ